MWLVEKSLSINLMLFYIWTIVPDGRSKQRWLVLYLFITVFRVQPRDQTMAFTTLKSCYYGHTFRFIFFFHEIGLKTLYCLMSFEQKTIWIIYPNSCLEFQFVTLLAILFRLLSRYYEFNAIGLVVQLISAIFDSISIMFAFLLFRNIWKTEVSINW